MARFSRLEVLNRIVEVGLVPVFYHGDIEIVSEVVAACAAGGVTLFEFTNRGDHAIEVFRALERRVAQQAREGPCRSPRRRAAWKAIERSGFQIGPSARSSESQLKVTRLR